MDKPFAKQKRERGRILKLIKLEMRKKISQQTKKKSRRH
jgi:hypothetical protein